MNSMNHIKDHFENEADRYDEIIVKLIPNYRQMVDASVSAIPFDNAQPLQVLDLGCGTGTVSKAILDTFPNARFTIVDIAPNMLKIAGNKIGSGAVSQSVCADFYELDLQQKYDAVVSSLALHHLVTDEDKRVFYRKIYSMLKPGGIFLNADVVLAANEQLQAMYMEKWIAFMNRSCSMDEINGTWLETYRREDRPAKLPDQIKWLEEIGFTDVDIVWKYFNFAVYGGTRK